LKVLVACEYSGRVRDAFQLAGHDAWSCDLLESESCNQNHIVGDVLEIINEGWDLMIAHPPCTMLTRAGARWWPGREDEQEEALNFVRALMDSPVPMWALENPPGAIGTRIRKADQYIQPWEHGHTEKKMTGLWLKGLPLLEPSNNVYDEMIRLPKKEQNKCHYAAPGKDRWKERSRTYEGIAKAMADQWGGVLDKPEPIQVGLFDQILVGR
jgi:hypothetical protein